jgi:MinD-like ATPase involved in chromosome partitioning or flagellar assembly
VSAQPEIRTPIATAIAVTSGKGGVGKTSLATNLGIALSRQGNRVCLLDADMGLANVNILLGLRTGKTVEDLLAGTAGLDDVMLAGPEGLRIIPAASDLRRAGAESTQTGAIAAQLRRLETEFDYVLVDTPAGIGPNTLSFVGASDHTLLTITQEPTSLTDAFTLLKALQRTRSRSRISVVINMLPSDQDGMALFTHFQAAARRYLSLELHYLGHLTMDSAVTRAVLRQRPVMVNAPDSYAATGLIRLGEQLRQWAPPRSGNRNFTAEWTGHRGHPPAPTGTDSDDTPSAPGAESAPQVITAPPPLQEPSRPAADANDPETAAAALTRWLESADTDDASARRVFSGLDQAFTRRFRRRASDIKTLVYEALLQGHLGREQHRELVQSLYTAYRRRYGGGYRPDATADSLEQLDDDALVERTRELHVRLGSNPELAQRLLGELLQAASAGAGWSRDHSVRLIEHLSRAEQARGAPPLPGPDHVQRLERLERALTERGETINSLQTLLEQLLRQQQALERGDSDSS